MAVLRLLDWGRHHPRFAALTAAIGDPGGAEARGLAVLAVVLLGSASLLFGFTLLLFTYPTAFDRTLHGLLLGLRSPPSDLILIGITELGDGLFLAIYAALVALALSWRDRSAARHWLAAVAFAMIAPVLLKGLFQVPRPEPFDALLVSSSFPSAHALRATVIYGFAAVLLARAVPQPWRWAPYGSAALLVASIAFSRPYLGVHWSGDVVAGALIGLIWVGLLGTAFRVRDTEPFPPWRQAGVVLLPLALIAALYLPLRLADDVARYDPAIAPTPLTAERWLDDPWQELTRRTPEAVAPGDEPRLAWAAPMTRMAEDLAKAGWAGFPDEGPVRWLRVLSPEVTLAELPPLPQVRDGRDQVLLRIREESGRSRLVLRFWDSGRRMDGNPVWIGRMSRERPGRLLGMLTYARGTPATEGDLAALESSLGTTGPRASDGVRLRIGPPGP
jgi:undecaprenyl-diphosphatase